MSYYCCILQPCVKQWSHIGGQSNSDANKDTAESEAFEKSRPTDRDWSREQSGRRKKRKRGNEQWTSFRKKEATPPPPSNVTANTAEPFKVDFQGIVSAYRKTSENATLVIP